MKRQTQSLAEYFSRGISAIVAAALLAASIAVITPQQVSAISYTGPATPSATTYGANTFGFQPDVPPTGIWTSTTTETPEGRSGSYMVPVLSGTCDAAAVTSLIMTIDETAISLAPNTSQDLSGVTMQAIDITDLDASWLPISEVLDGTPHNMAANRVIRGLTNPIFSGSSPSPIPGSLSFRLDITGMTVSNYHNIAITVYHDLLDGANGFINSVSSSQPVVQVVTNDAACYPAPAAQDDTNTTSVGQPLEVSAEDGLLKNDTGEDITVTSYTQPENGTVVVNSDGSYTYTPNEEFTGTDTFTYTITDSFGRTATATVTITVHPIPGPPAAGTQTARNLMLGTATILPMIALTIRYRNSIMRLLPQIRRHPQ